MFQWLKKYFKPKQSNPFDIFDQIYCLSLPKSQERRQHMQQELARVGIEKYIFFDAIDKDSDLVKKAFAEDFVVQFPPCFRCGQRKCDCDNNILIAPQVANCLSFQKLWQDIVKNQYSYSLILEDDVIFTSYYRPVIEKVFNLEFLNEYGFTKDSTSLLRLGWPECEDHHNIDLDNIRLVPDLVKMSNHCYMMTLGMAEKLLESFDKIRTTSDIYTHAWIGETVNNYTLIPPIVHDLSWSRGDFKSLIHPKENYINKLKSNKTRDPELIAQTEKEFERHFKKKLVRDILVVGHPQCGSKYMSQLLQEMGLDVGHESMGDQGISSWMFAVYDENNPWAHNKYALSRYYTDFDFLIHYVRDPRTAIPSIMGENKDNPASFDFRQKHIKQAFDNDLSLYETELEKAIVSFLKWNQIIEEQNPNLAVKVEACQTEILTFGQQNNLINKDLSINDINIDFSSEHKESLAQEANIIVQKTGISVEMWEKVSLDIKKELNNFCQKYGYPDVYDHDWNYLPYKNDRSNESIYIGFVGYGNLGDELLYSSIQTLFSETTKLYIPPQSEPLDILISENHFNSIMLGGGTLIKAPSMHLARLETLLKQKPNIPLIIFGTGVGDSEMWEIFGFETNKQGWCNIIEQSDFIGVRGPLSKQFLEEWGVKKDIKVVGDPALLFAQDSIVSKQKSKKIGINLGLSLWKEELIKGQNPQKVMDFGIKLLQYLHQENWEMNFFPMCVEDRDFMIEIIKQTDIREPKIHSFNAVPDSLFPALEEQDVFIGLKLHSVVLASCVYTPAIMLEYRTKCRDFMCSINREDWTFSTDNLALDTIIPSLLTLYDNIDEQQKMIFNAVQEKKNLLEIYAKEVKKMLNKE